MHPVRFKPNACVINSLDVSISPCVFSKEPYCLEPFLSFSIFFKKKILSFSDAVRKKYWCSVKMIVKFIWLSPCSAGVTCERTCGEEICQTESSSGGCQIRGAELCCEAPPADRPALWHRTATPWSLLHSWYILLMYMLKLEPVLTPIYTVG